MAYRLIAITHLHSKQLFFSMYFTLTLLFGRIKQKQVLIHIENVVSHCWLLFSGLIIDFRDIHTKIILF